MTNELLIQRLEKLEKSNRRLKIGATLGGVLAIAALFVGASGPQGPLTVNDHIKLVDSQGQTRAMIGADKQGTFFFLNDETGLTRTSIAAQKGQVYMNFKDPNKTTRAVIAFDEKGPSLELRADNNQPVNIVGAVKEGGLIQLVDDGGRARVLTPLADSVIMPQPPQAQPGPATPKR